MPLSASQRRYLRSSAHPLKPVILLGARGVTDSVLAELGRALDHHELVKVKLAGTDRAGRSAQVDALLAASGAELVQQIGHIAALYRRNPDAPRLALPR